MPKFCWQLMQLYNVQLIPGKAEITGVKGMYPRASGGLHVHVNINILFYYIMGLRISGKIQSCGFILPLRKHMINTLFRFDFF